MKRKAARLIRLFLLLSIVITAAMPPVPAESATLDPAKLTTDLNALENLIVKVSDFVEKNPQVKELDLNPVFAYSDGAVAVDARVVVEG